MDLKISKLALEGRENEGGKREGSANELKSDRWLRPTQLRLSDEKNVAIEYQTKHVRGGRKKGSGVARGKEEGEA